MKSLRAIAALAAILLALGLFVPGSAGSARTAGRGGTSGESDWKQAVREQVAGLAGRDQPAGKDPRQASPTYDGAEVVPGEFLVKPASGFFAADLETSFSGLGAEVLEDLEPAGLLLVGLPGAPDTGRALEALRSLPSVETAEPNLLRHFYAAPERLTDRQPVAPEPHRRLRRLGRHPRVGLGGHRRHRQRDNDDPRGLQAGGVNSGRGYSPATTP